MLPLDPWNKVMVVAGAAAAVAVTIFMVVCFLGDGCLVHELLSDTKSKTRVLYSPVRASTTLPCVLQERRRRRGGCLARCTARRTRPGLR